jgi:L-2,4-diaminobutyrate decarboxylase
VSYRSPEEEFKAWPLQEKSFESLVNDVLHRSMKLHHPRYMGHQTAVVVPLSALTELLWGLLNNSGAIFEMGPASGMMERYVLQWMNSKLGLGPKAEGIFTNGGTLGNLTALLAARRHVLGAESWGKGTAAHPPACFLASDQNHYSILRAVQIMGWGEEGIIKIPVDSQYALRADLLEEGLAKAEKLGRKVIGVIGNACSTATGSFDPLSDISKFCKKHKLWFHVDGAHGAAAVLSPKYRELTHGISEADSVVWDAHKLLMMPGLSTAVLFKKGEACYETFSQEASYLFERDAKSEWYNPCHRTVECTKRDLTFRLYTCLSVYGDGFLTSYVDRVFDLARIFSAKIVESPDFELAIQPQSNIVCFRYRPWGSGEESNRKHRELRKRLIDRGNFYIVQTELPTGVYLRTTLMNPFTEPRHLDELLAELRAIAKEA